MDRLHRSRLLLGEKGVNKLKNATVMVVGCGAVGSFAIEALARTGVGNLILIDFDKIEESNINRQLFATDSSIGHLKVDVAGERIFDINPDIKTTALNLFFDEKTSLDVTPDFVIDAIDVIPSKIALYKWCFERNIPFISSMGAARKTDPLQIKIAKISETKVCPLAARIRKLVKEKQMPDFAVVYSTESPNRNVEANRTFGSVITVTGVFGLVLANYVIENMINH